MLLSERMRQMHTILEQLHEFTQNLMNNLWVTFRFISKITFQLRFQTDKHVASYAKFTVEFKIIGHFAGNIAHNHHI